VFDPGSLRGDKALCLAAIADLSSDAEIPLDQLESRFSYYAECAGGAYCPEVAFDPIAIRLRSIAQRFAVGPTGAKRAAKWQSYVHKTLADLLELQRAARGRANSCKHEASMEADHAA